MGSAVSQLPYWIGAETANNSNGESAKGQLSYNFLIGLTFLGGFFGLDHLYLRSPLTSIAKMLMNTIFFGAWWLYDISQVVFNRDVVEVFGLGVPGLGPSGIGAGCLITNEPHKSHLRFILYGVSLLFGGIIGLDSFVLGDSISGIIRLVSLINVIGAPIAIVWWVYNMFLFLFQTKDVVDANRNFFNGESSSFADMIKRSSLFKLFEGTVGPIANSIDNLTEILKNGINIASGAFAGVEAIKALTTRVDATSKTYTVATDEQIQAAANARKAAKNEAAKAKEKGCPEVKPTNGSPPTTGPVTGPVTKSETNPETLQGGAIMPNSNMLPYTFMGTIIMIAVSGFLLTYRRSNKNERNDAPPEPGVFRKSDTEKYSA
jgi:TM2 domain-containing membrane protein YozV